MAISAFLRSGDMLFTFTRCNYTVMAPAARGGNLAVSNTCRRFKRTAYGVAGAAIVTHVGMQRIARYLGIMTTSCNARRVV